MAAIVVAAGASRRMGFDKIRADLAGRAVLEWSLAAFSAAPSVGYIVVVCPPGQRASFLGFTDGMTTPSEVVEGGEERPDSVLAGALALQRAGWNDWVAVHDAARPLILPEVIERCLKASMAQGAAAVAERVVDTLHRTDSRGNVLKSVPRENLWRVQTPQILPVESLVAMHGGKGFTDEVSALSHRGVSAVLVENEAPNFKITFPADLLLAAAVLEKRNP